MAQNNQMPNDFILKMLMGGGNPSATDFVAPFMDQKIGTPGINPNAEDPRMTREQPQGKIGNALGQADKFLSGAGGGMLMNLLAQSGYSTMPGSPFGAIGRAGLATQQQQQAKSRAALEDEFMRARIGLTNAQTDPQNVNAAANNVQTTFKGANGNMHVVTRSGEVKDTGTAFNENIKFFTQADGSVVGVDSSTGQRIGNVITPEEANAAETRKKQGDAAYTLPSDLASLDSTIAASDRVIGKIDAIMPLTEQAGIPVTLRGELPGGLGGDPRRLKKEAESLKANFGFDTLQKMRNASKTGGALGQVSERELSLLINALEAIDVEGEPKQLQENLQKVVLHYENYKREIEIMKNVMREQAGQAPVETTNEFEGFSIATD